MTRFAAFIVSGYVQATFCAVAFAWSTLFIPFGSILSAATLSLFSLRFGSARAFFLLILSSLALAFLSILASQFELVATNVGELLILFVFMLWLPTLLSTEVIRRTNSLSFLFQTYTVIGIAFVSLVAILFPESVRVDFWRQFFDWMVEGDVRDIFDQRPELEEQYRLLLTWMTGFLTSSLLLVWIPSLLLAYWWGSLLLSPGSFKKIFTRVELGKVVAAAAALVIALAVMLEPAVAMELLIVLVTICLFQGIATIHFMLARKDSRFVLFLFYGVLVFSPVLLIVPVLVATLGFLENFINLRKLIGLSNSEPM